MTTHQIIVGDARRALREIPNGSVQCCVTSPPFWALRDYGVDGQLGLERTPARYIVAMLRVFREVHRILRSDGTLWIEIGDCYAGDGGAGGGGWFGTSGPSEARVSQRERKYSGAKIKDLVGIPWMLAFALRSRGWYWRQTCVWGRQNARPEGAQDRPHTAHTIVLLFSRSKAYFYDPDAVRQRTTGTAHPRGQRHAIAGPDAHGRRHARPRVGRYFKGIPTPDRHLRSVEPAPVEVWTIPSAAGEDGHPASFPPELAARCIRAGTRMGDAVLDPFAGSGTVGYVARVLGRSSIGIELNPRWAAQAELRVSQQMLPLVVGGPPEDPPVQLELGLGGE